MMVKIRPRKNPSEEKTEQGVETSVAEQAVSPAVVPVTRSRSLMLKKEARRPAWYRRSSKLQPASNNETEVEVDRERLNKEPELSTSAQVEPEDCKAEPFLTAPTSLSDDNEPGQPRNLENSAQSTQMPCDNVCTCGMLWQGVDQELKVLEAKSEKANSVLAQHMVDLETRYTQEGQRFQSQVRREIETLRGLLDHGQNSPKWDSLYRESPDLVTKLERGESASDAKRNPGRGFWSHDQVPKPVELQLEIVRSIDLNTLPVMTDSDASGEFVVRKAVRSKEVEDESRSSEDNPGTGQGSDKAENSLELQQSALRTLTDDHHGTGSYAEDCLNPADLQTAVRSVKMRVTKFAKHFSEYLNKRKLESLLKAWYPRVYFIRGHHMLSYAVKASINNGLFKGFEKEDFASGITLYFDQITRSKTYTEYFREQRTGEDPLFSNFKQKKFYWLMKKFELCSDEALVKWGNSLLAPEFNSMVTSIWLLHKAAFAFATPASIFRIQENVELKEEYMESVEILYEDQQCVPRVAFMIMPGFRLGKTVIKAEIYPSMQHQSCVNAPSAANSMCI